MKKFIAIIAAIAMIATMSVSVFAANDITAIGGTASEEITVNYVEGEEGKRVDVVVVDVAWSDMVFTYTVATEAWNADDLVWEDATGAWTGTAKVAVTNRSSKPVNASVEYTADKVAADKVTCDEGVNIAVGTAKNGETPAAPITETLEVTVKGDAAAITAEDDGANAGTVKLTIANVLS